MKSRNKIFVWTLYDLGNTSYSIVVVTFLYAVYFKKIVAENAPIGDFYWSLGTSISMIITAIIAPILGAIADFSSGKKRFLLFFTLLCIISTASLYFVKEGNILGGLLLFILANLGFEAGLVFYDAFLPEITLPKNYGRVSGYGYAMGYLGSLASLALVYPFIASENLNLAFPISALFFLVFAIPIFVFLKDSRKESQIVKVLDFAKIGIERVAFTLKNLKHYKNLTTFLIAYFFYIEGVNTVIYFSGNYAATTLKFSDIELLLFFLTVQTTAIGGSVILGIIADSIGQKSTIIISLFIWIFTILLAYFTVNKSGFYIVGLLAGAAMGSSQSTSRSLMSKLTPFDRKTEFFGFYSFFGKSSAILGPLIFGLISYITHNQRYAILSVLFFFLVGMFFLFRVKENNE